MLRRALARAVPAQRREHLLPRSAGPSAKHWFGTDDAGRDQFSQIMFAGRVSLRIGLAVALLSTVVGVASARSPATTAVARPAARAGSPTCSSSSPTSSVLAVAPHEVRASPRKSIIFVLAALGWTYVARVVRGQVLSLKEKEFVEAARGVGRVEAADHRAAHPPEHDRDDHGERDARGRGGHRCRVRAVVPGLRRATAANSWGRMLADAEPYATDPHRFYLVFFPGLFLVLTVLAVNFLGDGLRDAFDPQSQL